MLRGGGIRAGQALCAVQRSHGAAERHAGADLGHGRSRGEDHHQVQWPDQIRNRRRCRQVDGAPHQAQGRRPVRDDDRGQHGRRDAYRGEGHFGGRGVARLRTIQHGLHCRHHHATLLRGREERSRGDRRGKLLTDPHVHRRVEEQLRAAVGNLRDMACRHAGKRKGNVRHRLSLRARYAQGVEGAFRHHHGSLRRQHRRSLDQSRN